MAAARSPAATLLLAGLAAAGDPAGSRSDRAVGALLGLLLCLAVGLALAWRHLCHVSAGRYHPRPAGRRALALLRGRWRRLRGHESAAEPGAHGNEAPEAEELMPWGTERQQREPDGEDEEEEEEEEDGEEEAPQGPAEQPHAAPGDAHVLAGTAAWGEARPWDGTAL
ncbi:protein tyrosine phosphatase receptor type C-associated protein [Cyrtonyx montezumae]|uniref:protein tyrosine phosphatase receptor type C-associated protein n=1 Tax=Cyrtonyx montezumae TaxID=9017 RepID=UPI0032DB5587